MTRARVLEKVAPTHPLLHSESPFAQAQLLAQAVFAQPLAHTALVAQHLAQAALAQHLAQAALVQAALAQLVADVVLLFLGVANAPLFGSLPA